VIDADLTAYLIPYEVVAGYASIQLSRYEAFIVARCGSMLAA
jgi:hypothetical protein